MKDRLSNNYFRWLLCGILFLPVVVFYFFHYFHAATNPDLRATGFILYDMPYYLSLVREFFDHGSFHPLMSNPFSLEESPQGIYFQPLFFVWALIWHFLKIPLVVIFLISGVVTGLLFIRVCFAIYDSLYKFESAVDLVVFTCLIWGGGLLAAAGLLYGVVHSTVPIDLFRYDPFGGWWFLNLGRNLIFPSESFYHLLVFGAFLAACHRKFGIMLALLFTLSFSHSFTGIEFISVFAAWMACEYALKTGVVGFKHVLGGVVLLALHLTYYLFYLTKSAEHASLMRQWALPWILPASALLPAYGLALCGVIGQFFIADLRRDFFKKPMNRLLMVWFAVCFTLANHELFMKPVQPLHFTRGYIWSSLFLLGIPTYKYLLTKAWHSGSRAIKYAVPLIFLVVSLADNTLWIASNASQRESLYYSPDQQKLLNWLKNSTDGGKNGGWLVTSNDPMTSYYVTVFTPLKVVYAHQHCTPFSDQRRRETVDYFLGKPTSWDLRPLLVVESVSSPLKLQPRLLKGGNEQIVYRNDSFVVVARNGAFQQ